MSLRRFLGYSDGELMRSDAKPCSRLMRHTAGIYSVGGALGFWILCRLHYEGDVVFSKQIDRDVVFPNKIDGDVVFPKRLKAGCSITPNKWYQSRWFEDLDDGMVPLGPCVECLPADGGQVACLVMIAANVANMSKVFLTWRSGGVFHIKMVQA